MEEVGWGYQLSEARQRDDVTLLMLNPKLTVGSLLDFALLDMNFVESFRVFADVLQNAKLPLTLGAR